MMQILNTFLLTFIPIFVAVDSIGNIPLFVSLVEGTTKKQRHKIIVQSITTATAVAVVFMFVGRWILTFIGITIPDFQIAGGALLFIISMRLLLPGSSKTFLSNGHDKDVGVFPLGTPLITGPAVLTTTLIMLNNFGAGYTFASLMINMFIVWITLAKADTIMRFLGTSGTRAFAKIMYILLAAIGVMMARKGITELIHLP
ncbi:MAG: MarC family protein [Candidatus Omnitrophica bacterium]|nr:MarC family protein [Candidatus Omnitrophota bacterium]MDD5237199.1 MarC family protein [Candidatus Omnitrophota bacterium]MDD5610341.1 MarC family protein [Candidatus Omnitrophota bacterium]